MTCKVSYPADPQMRRLYRAEWNTVFHHQRITWHFIVGPLSMCIVFDGGDGALDPQVVVRFSGVSNHNVDPTGK